MGQRTCSTWSGRDLPWWPPFAAAVLAGVLLTRSAVWQPSLFAAETARPSSAEVKRLVEQLGS